MRTLSATVFWLVAAVAAAYNPPVDRAGPITARIEAPATVAALAEPLAVRVILENASAATIACDVDVRLADPWRAAPGGSRKASVPARGNVALDYQLSAGAGCYSAHYPVHAYVRFSHEGAAFEAHPVLIFQTRLPSPPRAVAAVAFEPLKVQPDSRLALWTVPARRYIVASAGKPAEALPAGWSGSHEASKASGHSSTERIAGELKEILRMHPPYAAGRVGALAVEFPLELPPSSSIALQFANAVQRDGTGDGVTFRVRVAAFDAPAGALGEVVFERHTASKDKWIPGQGDLNRFAGQRVRVQLESHPGPKNNTAFDASFWAEPTLVVGNPPPPAAFPPADAAGSRSLGTIAIGAAKYDVRAWPGRRGLFDAAVGFLGSGRTLYFRGFEARVLGAAIHDPRSPILLVEAKAEPGEGLGVRHRFQSHLGTFDVVGRLRVVNGTLRAEFSLENAPAAPPWQAVVLEDLAAGPWSDEAAAAYAGHGNIIRRPQAFNLNFDGHRLSTSFVGFDFPAMSIVQAVEPTPTTLAVDPAKRQYSLRLADRGAMVFVPAADAWEAVRHYRQTNGLRAAAGVKHAAGRFVFDLWGGRYAESREALQKSFRYGLTDAMIVWHNWQRWGYDYRLPDIYPPSPKLGTLAEMQELIAAAKTAGVRFAPHDNYIDFYPDADEFSYDRLIAFRGPGAPQKAWLNEGRDAQSYRYRADAIEPFVRRNLKLIRDGLAPDAFFIDVWSSAGPYGYWTHDGRYVDRQYTREVWGKTFAWIRDFLGGDAPQISESGHDGLIGWLDGGQTNHFRVGPPQSGKRGWCVWNIPCQDAERTPWFDAAHHDRFINHGAGYPGRYEGGLDPRTHGIYSDDYIATEVLTGHPAMVSRPFGHDVVRKYWLLAAIGRGLAMRTLERVEYVGGDIHRQRVFWSGGAQAWVNRGPSDWQVEGRTLPEYGFYARVPADDGLVEAQIVRRGGQVVETARDPKTLYVNGRELNDGPKPIQLRTTGMRTLGPREFELDLEWKIETEIPAGWAPFLHCCDAEGEIVCQASHRGRLDGKRGRFAATARLAVPAAVQAETQMELRWGFYRPGGGDRMALPGLDDGGNRIRVAKLTVKPQAGGAVAVELSPIAHRADEYLARHNVKATPVDFDALHTAGGCRLSVEGRSLLVTPLPGDKPFSARIRWSKLPWQLPPPARLEAVDLDGKPLAGGSLAHEGEWTAIIGPPGAFCLRLSAK